MVVHVLVTKTGLSQSLYPVFIILELRSENNFFFEGELKVCVLPDHWVVMNKFEQTWQADIVPTNICDNCANLILAATGIHDPNTECSDNFILTSNLEPFMFEHLLKVIRIEKSYHGIVHEHVETFADGAQNDGE
jgi:hypothetical protein